MATSQPGAFSNESATLNPSSPYSASKAASDFLVLSYVRTYGFPALITRSSNNYGPFQFPEKFLPLMITNALDNKPLPIYGDGKQQRDWLHVEDNCRGILAVLERGQIGEVYNLGGIAIEENLTMAKRLLRVMGKPETLLTYVKDRPGHDRRYALDCKKIETEIGWKPAIASMRGCARRLHGMKPIPNGSPACVAANISPITKNTTRIAILRSMRFRTNGAERCKISFHDRRSRKSHEGREFLAKK